MQDKGFQFFVYAKDSSLWYIAVHPEAKGDYWIESIK